MNRNRTPLPDRFWPKRRSRILAAAAATLDRDQRRPLPRTSWQVHEESPVTDGGRERRSRSKGERGMSMFASPGEWTGGWNAKEAIGHLLVIEVQSFEKDIPTSLGDKDAIKATVHDITDQETFEDTLIFPRVLIGSLKGRIGQKVLGTVGQGVAKPGQKAPYVLFDASGDPASVDAASAYLTGAVAEVLTTPGPAPASAPAPAPVPAVAGAGPVVDLAGKTPAQVAALKEMGLA